MATILISTGPLIIQPHNPRLVERIGASSHPLQMGFQLVPVLQFRHGLIRSNLSDEGRSLGIMGQPKPTYIFSKCHDSLPTPFFYHSGFDIAIDFLVSDAMRDYGEGSMII